MIGTVSARALLERIDQELALRAAAPEVSWEAGAREVLALSGRSPGDASLRPQDHAPIAAPVLHSLAVIESARFAELAARPDDPGLTDSATHLIHAWAALAGREAYLVELARGMAVPIALPAIVDVVGRRGVDQVAAALLDRVQRGTDLAPLLRALALAAVAETGPRSLPRPLRMLADRRRVDAIEALLTPIRSVFDDLGARAATEKELVSVFTRVHEAWRRSDRDIELEILAVERLPDFAWDFYREKRFKELARVLVPVAEPVMSLAARVERGESAVAWAAPCAQAIVFHAELADRFDQQLELAERAFTICPSLRNARVVLGDFLITRAERALDRGAERTSNGTLPAEDIARAEQLYPELRRLPAARSKLLAKKTGAVRA
jgi:hypothetical protein